MAPACLLSVQGVLCLAPGCLLDAWVHQACSQLGQKGIQAVVVQDNGDVSKFFRITTVQGKGSEGVVFRAQLSAAWGVGAGLDVAVKRKDLCPPPTPPNQFCTLTPDLLDSSIKLLLQRVEVPVLGQCSEMVYPWGAIFVNTPTSFMMYEVMQLVHHCEDFCLEAQVARQKGAQIFLHSTLSHWMHQLLAVEAAGHVALDFKPTQCLRNTVTQELKLGDLGSVRPKGTPLYGAFIYTTPVFSPPESSLPGAVATTEHDMWSLGISAYTMAVNGQMSEFEHGPEGMVLSPGQMSSLQGSDWMAVVRVAERLTKFSLSERLGCMRQVCETGLVPWQVFQYHWNEARMSGRATAVDLALWLALMAMTPDRPARPEYDCGWDTRVLDNLAGYTPRAMPHIPQVPVQHLPEALAAAVLMQLLASNQQDAVSQVWEHVLAPAPTLPPTPSPGQPAAPLGTTEATWKLVNMAASLNIPITLVRTILEPMAVSFALAMQAEEMSRRKVQATLAQVAVRNPVLAAAVQARMPEIQLAQAAKHVLKVDQELTVAFGTAVTQHFEQAQALRDAIVQKVQLLVQAQGQVSVAPPQTAAGSYSMLTAGTGAATAQPLALPAQAAASTAVARATAMVPAAQSPAMSSPTTAALAVAIDQSARSPAAQEPAMPALVAAQSEATAVVAPSEDAVIVAPSEATAAVAPSEDAVIVALSEATAAVAPSDAVVVALSGATAAVAPSEDAVVVALSEASAAVAPSAATAMAPLQAQAMGSAEEAQTEDPPNHLVPFTSQDVYLPDTAVHSPAITQADGQAPDQAHTEKANNCTPSDQDPDVSAAAALLADGQQSGQSAPSQPAPMLAPAPCGKADTASAELQEGKASSEAFAQAAAQSAATPVTEASAVLAARTRQPPATAKAVPRQPRAPKKPAPAITRAHGNTATRPAAAHPRQVWVPKQQLAHKSVQAVAEPAVTAAGAKNAQQCSQQQVPIMTPLPATTVSTSIPTDMQQPMPSTTTTKAQPARGKVGHAQKSSPPAQTQPVSLPAHHTLQNTCNSTSQNPVSTSDKSSRAAAQSAQGPPPIPTSTRMSRQPAGPTRLQTIQETEAAAGSEDALQASAQSAPSDLQVNASRASRPLASARRTAGQVGHHAPAKPRQVWVRKAVAADISKAQAAADASSKPGPSAAQDALSRQLQDAYARMRRDCPNQGNGTAPQASKDVMRPAPPVPQPSMSPAVQAAWGTLGRLALDLEAHQAQWQQAVPGGDNQAAPDHGGPLQPAVNNAAQKSQGPAAQPEGHAAQPHGDDIAHNYRLDPAKFYTTASVSPAMTAARGTLSRLSQELQWYQFRKLRPVLADNAVQGH